MNLDQLSPDQARKYLRQVHMLLAAGFTNNDGVLTKQFTLNVHCKMPMLQFDVVSMWDTNTATGQITVNYDDYTTFDDIMDLFHTTNELQFPIYNRFIYN